MHPSVMRNREKKNIKNCSSHTLMIAAIVINKSYRRQYYLTGTSNTIIDGSSFDTFFHLG